MPAPHRVWNHFQIYKFPDELVKELSIHCIRNGLNKPQFVAEVLAKAIGYPLEKLPYQVIKSRVDAAKAAIKVAKEVHK